MTPDQLTQPGFARMHAAIEAENNGGTRIPSPALRRHALRSPSDRWGRWVTVVYRCMLADRLARTTRIERRHG